MILVRRHSNKFERANWAHYPTYTYFINIAEPLTNTPPASQKLASKYKRVDKPEEFEISETNNAKG